MGSVTAERLAAEFARLLGEGWTPDLDEFLGRVPEQHRGECRRHIEQLALRNGMGITLGPPEPEPGCRESVAEKKGPAVPVAQGHDNEALEWIETQVSVAGAGAASGWTEAKAKSQPAVAVPEAHAEEQAGPGTLAMKTNGAAPVGEQSAADEFQALAEEDIGVEALDDRRSEAPPVVRVKLPIDELWGQVGAEEGASEEGVPAVAGLLSAADELRMRAARPSKEPGEGGRAAAAEPAPWTTPERRTGPSRQETVGKPQDALSGMAKLEVARAETRPQRLSRNEAMEMWRGQRRRKRPDPRRT